MNVVAMNKWYSGYQRKGPEEFNAQQEENCPALSKRNKKGVNEGMSTKPGLSRVNECHDQ